MRVLYLVERFWPYIGGVEVAGARVLPELTERGHEFLVVTSRDDPRLPEHDEYRGVQIRRLPLTSSLQAKDPEQIVRVREGISKLMADWRPDLIHTIFTGPGIVYSPVMSGSNAVPMLLSFHGSWPGPATGFLARAIASAAWVTACSHSALEDLRAIEPAVRDRSSALLNGLDPPELPPSALPLDPPVLTCAGRLVEEKGYDIALEALAQVRSVRPDVRLVLAGDGPQRRSLERQAEELAVASNVAWRGWVSPRAIPSLINDSTAVLVPSRREGFGLTALEAALMARPVVASRVGGLPEVIRHGETGVLVEPDSPAALAAGILGLLSNPEGARRMGEAGRSRAIEKFSAARHANEYEELYLRLVAREPSVAA